MSIQNYDNRRTQIALQAIELINGPRQDAYGPPDLNMARLAQRWSQRLGIEVSPVDAAIMLVELKLSRLMHSDSADGFRDAIGYIAIAAEVSGVNLADEDE